jgi:hypothetical protein
MSQPSFEPDPYAELEYRADAGELSEDFRKPVRVLLARPRDLRMTRTAVSLQRRSFAL